ncbi:Glucuronoxylan 4-O-methyltransferase 2 [Camellia lanceoleosa]|uniref:Glucuronoxylan 4-O-methyltransferase 2 n=1 Tax=Camellia lanceoleosa TaxID=1840588 RepID=A0ACC0I1Y0_9ERIC|nr:Glucuronoxylan 4-O-methyltransferase 2 [Camellia lanceoleosa]
MLSQETAKMPPQVSQCQPNVTPLVQLLPLSRGTKKTTVPKKKLIPVLLFLLSGMSILRLLKIFVFTSFSSPPLAWPPTHLHKCSSPTPAGFKKASKSQPVSSASDATLTEKEYRLLLNIISARAPCNLLIFGFEPQYLNLSSSINAGGTTVFLEDNPEKLATIKTNHNNTRIYRVEYLTLARDAYKLLKHARQSLGCALHSGSLKKSSCPLALRKLPREVYKRQWDVVVVDGPSGDKPDAPGRMTAIYTASVIARAGNMTDVVVHDIDRMIEKWFAWEFLCNENLVSSKGKLWNFRIASRSSSTEFCPAKTILIEPSIGFNSSITNTLT